MCLLLKHLKILESNSKLPFIKPPHKLGFKARLPHYNTFNFNAVQMGIVFGAGLGLLTLLNFFGTPPMLSRLLLTFCLEGIFFGLAMASYYKYRANKYWLTPREK